MGTLTLLGLRNLWRAGFNEASTTRITDAELTSIANDGYKDTAVKGLCYESKIAKTNIPASVRLVSLVGNNVVRVMYVEYDLSPSGSRGLLCIPPPTVGHAPIKNYTPAGWFQWGNYVVVEPPPDVATYDLNIFAACYPAAVMTNDSDTPSSLPVEFHESIYLYGKAYVALKLKRWKDFVLGYNEYIDTLQFKRLQFISKFPEVRTMHEIPDDVMIANG
jgi:hypothetical protein